MGKGDNHQAFKNIWQLRTEVITSNEQTEQQANSLGNEMLCRKPAFKKLALSQTIFPVVNNQ